MRLLARLRCFIRGGHRRGGPTIEFCGHLELKRCPDCGTPIFEHVLMGAFTLRESEVGRTALELREMRKAWEMSE